MNAHIIGISGTNGSGKDTVGQLLADHFGYCFVSVTTSLRDELARQNLPSDREHMRELSAEWRRTFGYAVLVDRALEAYGATEKHYSGIAIASLRNPAEADRVHERGGMVLWLDADQLLRFERVQANAAARNRSDEDNRTFEQFQSDEAAEMHTSGDAATLDMAAVKDRADHLIVNEYATKEELLPILAAICGRELPAQ